jgi:hypothetical protein
MRTCVVWEESAHVLDRGTLQVVRAQHHRELVMQLCAQVRVLGDRGALVARGAELRLIDE